MLAILFNILSVLGIILLVLLGILLIVLLLVLFVPISYRIYGSKNTEAMLVKINVNWLFGLLRIRFVYPEPGKVVAKLLCFTIYDSSASKEKLESKKTDSVEKKKQSDADEAEKEVCWESLTISESSDGSEEGHTQNVSTGKISGSDHCGAATENAASGDTKNIESDKLSFFQDIKQYILKKYEKIKYTILRIYDKIKKILENLAFYKELLQEEDTKALLRHAKRRVMGILKKLRPRRLKAEILFGTGSPDTTGYVLGVYGILSPQFRKPCYVNLTPDFTQAVFRGELDAAGYITVFCILSNGILLLLDKRLRMLIHKIKKHNAANNI